jgi:6-phosphogluconolactonase
MGSKHAKSAARRIKRRTILIAGVTGAMSLALPGTSAWATPDKPTYVYVTSNAGTGSPDSVGLYVFRYDPEGGTLTQVQQVPSANPSWLALDPTGRFLYVCYSLRGTVTFRVGLVEAYSINPGNGMLTLLNRVSLNSGPAQLAVSPDGRQLVVANYYYGDYVVMPIGPDGRVGDISGKLQNSGSGPNPRQDGPHPHAVVFDPKGRFIGAADLGNDTVETLRLDGGGLERVSKASVTPGMGPRHLVYSRNGRTLYVIGELDGKIKVFDYDPVRGGIGGELQTVSTEPSDYSGPHSGAEIRMHPSGKFLYASNRGSQTIAGYRIDPAMGELSLIGFATQGVNGPTSFTIDPTGKWLYVPSNLGNAIVQFRIDHTTGELTPTGQSTPLPAPNVMVFRAWTPEEDEDD